MANPEADLKGSMTGGSFIVKNTKIFLMQFKNLGWKDGNGTNP